MKNIIKGTLNRTAKSRLVIPALATAVIALSFACESSVVPTAIPQATSASADRNSITPILATNVLEVGEQRLAFLMATTKGLIKTPTALVTPIFLDGDGAPSATMEAAFNLWPYGIRGSYSTYVNFDRAGRWRLNVQVDNPDGMDEAQFEVQVMEKSPVPALGSKALLSVSKSLAGHGAIEEITTDYSPDPDLYQLTVKEAVENLLPSVVVFASPAFCTSPTCGPQVDTITELKDRYPGEANYIHVEIYDRPAEIQGDLERAEIFGVVDDWGLTSIEGYSNESWTFIIDADGMIDDRFEGFATLGELEIALIKVLSRP